MQEISPTLTRRLQAEVAPGERVLWRGCADPWASFMSKWTALPFGLVWVGFMAALLHHVLRIADLTAAVFALIFLGVGLFILLQPAAAYLEARRTLFAVTDRRVLVVRQDGGRVRSIARDGLRHVERVRSIMGSETVRIPLRAVDDGDGGKAVEYLEMHGLGEADRVFQLLSR